MRILAIVPQAVLAHGYLRSQVLSPFAFLASLGHDVWILTLGCPSEDVGQRLLAETTAQGLHVVLIPPAAFSPVNYMRAFFAALRLIWRQSPDALYAREVFGGGIALLARWTLRRPGLQIIYDFRGAIPEEISFYARGASAWFKRHLFTFLEQRLAAHSTRLNAVTLHLSRHVAQRYGRGADTVIPCCVDLVAEVDADERERVREALGVTASCRLYVFSGSLNQWQCFDETVRLFSMISERDEFARLLVLTPELDKASAALAACLPTDRFRVKSVPQKDVTRYLSACDVGFLLREDSIVNQVAFPIKFGEYLSAGLGVIATEGVSVIADILRQEGLGVVIHSHNPNLEAILAWADEQAASGTAARWKAQHYVRARLSWPSYIEEFRVLYGVERELASPSAAFLCP